MVSKSGKMRQRRILQPQDNFGSILGTCEGASIQEGKSVGIKVGEILGLLVGRFVGEPLGLLVG